MQDINSITQNSTPYPNLEIVIPLDVCNIHNKAKKNKLYIF